MVYGDITEAHDCCSVEGEVLERVCTNGVDLPTLDTDMEMAQGVGRGMCWLLRQEAFYHTTNCNPASMNKIIKTNISLTIIYSNLRHCINKSMNSIFDTSSSLEWYHYHQSLHAGM